MNPKNKKILLFSGVVIGAVIIVIGIFSTINPIMDFFSIMEIENDALNDPFISNESKIYSLEAGRYDVYYYSEFYTTPGSITIKNPSGEDVYSNDYIFSSGHIGINDRDYYKIGSFKAETDGDYSVNIENPGVILIMNSWLIFENIITIIIYIFMIILGALILTICVIFLIIDHVRNQKKQI